MLNGSKNAVYCAVTLFTVYSVWMAISKIAEEGGLCDKLSTLLKKPIKRIFKTDDGEAVKCVSMNVVCNILGLGGAATPFAIRAINRFNGKNNAFAMRLLFIINAASVQIIPTTVIALRASYNSVSPSDIFIPSLICSGGCLALSLLIFLVTEKVWQR